jgi:uridine kinase
MKDVAVPSSRYLIVDGALAHIILPACVELGISTVTVYVHVDLAERVRRIADRNRANPRRQIESEVAAVARVSAMAKGEARWVLPQMEKADIVIQSDVDT